MKKILIVDDDLYARMIVRLILDSDKYYMIEATDGMEALQRAVSEQPNLIVLDVMMPNMDGFTVCQQIKSHPDLAQIKIIMLTVRSDAEDRARGQAVGADDYLVKPFSPAVLREAVDRLLPD